MPIIRINSKIKMTGSSKTSDDSSIPIMKSRGNRTINSKVEPMRFARLLEKTNSHLGK